MQRVLNEAMGTAQAADDLNGDGAVGAVDVETVIGAALNQGCWAR